MFRSIVYLKINIIGVSFCNISINVRHMTKLGFARNEIYFVFAKISRNFFFRFRESYPSLSRNKSRNFTNEISRNFFREILWNKFRGISRNLFREIRQNNFCEILWNKFRRISRNQFRKISQNTFREISKNTCREILRNTFRKNLCTKCSGILCNFHVRKIFSKFMQFREIFIIK